MPSQSVTVACATLPARRKIEWLAETATSFSRIEPLQITNGTMEGFGGPVRLDRPDFSDIDPTLDACCRREAESNRKQGAVLSALQRHDRVALAERRKKHLLDGLSWGSGCRCCYDPNSDGGEYGALTEARRRLAEERGDVVDNNNDDDENEDIAGDGGNVGKVTSEPAFEGGRKDNNNSGSDSDSDDEFDYLLDDDLPGEDGQLSALALLEEARRAELEMTVMEREAAVQHGFGAHRQLHPSRVLRAAGLGMDQRTMAATVAPAVVLHLYDPESDMSASLDLFLEGPLMAGTYRGTKFLRGSGRPALLLDADLAQRELPRLRPEADLPALIAIRSGNVVAHCPALENLGSKSEGTIEPRAVEEFLDRAGVLLREPPAFEDLCRIRPEEMMLLENMAMERNAASAAKQPEPESFYDCGVAGCNKTFHHNHVGVQTEQQDGLILCQEIATGESDAAVKL